MLHQTHSAALHQSSSKAATSTRKPLVISAAAGGFGRSNKKKVDTSGGMVVPEKPFRNATLEDLRDDAPTKNKKSKTAEEGAPAGFPEGVSLALGGEVARLGGGVGASPVQPLSAVTAVSAAAHTPYLFQLQQQDNFSSQAAKCSCSPNPAPSG